MAKEITTRSGRNVVVLEKKLRPDMQLLNRRGRHSGSAFRPSRALQPLQQTLGGVKYSTVSLSHGVVDQHRDLDERDARPHAVEPRDPLHQRLVEESLSRFLGVPNVEGDRLACFWVESERLASQSGHFFEPRARSLGDLANLRPIEVTLVAKRNENADHGCLPCRTALVRQQCSTSYLHFAFTSDDFVCFSVKQSARHRSSRILDDSTNEEATLVDFSQLLLNRYHVQA